MVFLHTQDVNRMGIVLENKTSFSYPCFIETRNVPSSWKTFLFYTEEYEPSSFQFNLDLSFVLKSPPNVQPSHEFVRVYSGPCTATASKEICIRPDPWYPGGLETQKVYDQLYALVLA